MEIDLKKLNTLMVLLTLENRAERFDKLYKIAFMDNGELPEDFSVFACESYRVADPEVRVKAFELSKHSLKSNACFFRDFYSTSHGGEKPASISEKADLYMKFFIWVKTRIISQALECECFSEKELLVFLEESLHVTIDYAQNPLRFEREMYSLLTEGLSAAQISREEFLSLQTGEREKFGLDIWNYHAKSNLDRYLAC